MANAPSSTEILNREFLEIRAKILELAASFDRIDRASGDIGTDPRVTQINESIKVLLSEKFDDRAAAVQMIYSLPYSDSWRGDFNL